MLILAQTATNDALGTWVVIGSFVLSGLVSLAGLLSFFATRREVSEIKERQAALEEDFKARMATIEANILEMNKDNEARAKDLHDRINPVTERLAELNGKMGAFCQSFDNFTEVIRDVRRETK